MSSALDKDKRNRRLADNGPTLDHEHVDNAVFARGKQNAPKSKVPAKVAGPEEMLALEGVNRAFGKRTQESENDDEPVRASKCGQTLKSPVD